MALPPFDIDQTKPADNDFASQFPANERANRDEIESIIAEEHDVASGHHAFPVLARADITALSSPPTGMIVYNSERHVQQINTGTPAAPVWFDLGPQPGTTSDHCGTTAPAGYLACDGSAVSRTTYPELFAAIGTTWGAGDGSTTFNLPNFARRATVGSGGTGTATLGNAVGNTGGEETHTLTTDEMPSHGHGVTDPKHQHDIHTGGGSGGTEHIQTNNGGSLSNPAVTQPAATGISIQNTGGGAAHNIMQPSAVVLKCIKF